VNQQVYDINNINRQAFIKGIIKGIILTKDCYLILSEPLSKIINQGKI
jgi:hypothetical protein